MTTTLDDERAARALVDELRALGVRLWAADGRVRFRAPRDVLTDDRRRALRERRDSVLSLLNREAAREDLVPDPAAADEPFPLTDVQTAYLLGRHDSFGYGRVACCGYQELRYPRLDPARLEDAWNRLVARHGMLRAVIEPEGSQRVLDRADRYRVAVTDLRDADPERIEEHLRAVRGEMDHRMPDTREWPLFELRATRTPTGTIVHLALDSLVCDWGSAGVLLDELDVLLDDPDAPLPGLDIGFRDYVLAERRLRDGDRYERDRAYWWDRIDDLPPAPELPVLPEGRAGAAADGRTAAPARFRRHGFRLSAEHTAALRERVRRHGLTDSTVLLTAYATVLQRWSRHDRFTLDLTVLDRRPLHPQVGRLVGDFTSVTLVDVAAPDGRGFAARAAEMHERVLTDLDHGLCSGIEVLRELSRRRGRDEARMPVVFTSGLGVGPGSTPDRGHGRTFGYGLTQTPQVLLDCQAGDDRGGLRINWDVRQGVFPPGLVEDMIDAYRALLEELAGDEAAWTGPRTVPLPAWQAAERRRVNATGAPPPAEPLHVPVLARAAARPDAPCVIDARGTTSYGEVAARAGDVARALTEAGCRPGDRVAVVMEKGAEQVVAVLGALCAGAAYVPVDAAQPGPRRARMIADSGARIALTQSWLDLGGLMPESVIAVDALPAGDPGEPVAVDAGDLAYVIYTSGSTGAPKGVMITHRAARTTIEDINHRIGLGSRDRVLGLAELGFDLSVYDVFGTLAAGATLVLTDPARRGDPSHWRAAVLEHGITVWNSVPAQMQMLATHLETDPAGLSTLRTALLSGDWIPITLPERLAALVPGLELIALGGATEAAVWSIQHRIDGVHPSWTSIPYGTPLTGQGFRVLDRGLRDAPVWVTGELAITGAGLAMGYLGDEALTAERFIHHPVDGERLYRTGDLGRYLPGGEIEFQGREDGQVKLRGHRIELGEVEAALLAHPCVAAAAAVVSGTAGPAAADRRLLAFATATRARPDPAPGTSETESIRGTDPAASDPFAPVPDPTAGKAGTVRGTRPATSEPRASEPPVAGWPVSGPLATAVVETAGRAGDGAVAAISGAAIGGHIRAVAEAAHLTMLYALDARGALADGSTAADVVRTVAAAPRHEWLVRRWLDALVRDGRLDLDAAGRYARTGTAGPVRRDTVDAAWRRVRAGAGSGLCSGPYVDYLTAHADRIHALLDGEQDPFALLFPEGRLDVARAVYRDDIAERFANAAGAAAVAAAVDERAAGSRPARLLEIGAGTGALTDATVAALAGRTVDYLVTDLNPMFPADARERLGDHAGLRFGVFDIDRDYRAQGLEPNTIDVVLCAGVLSSTADAARTVAAAVELLAPGGWLVVTEPARDEPHILLTQGFMLPPAGGDHVDGATPFRSVTAWRELFAAAGVETVASLPDDHHPLAAQGMRVLLGRVKTDRAPLTAGELGDFVAARLPAPMVPAHVQVVDALPVTANGKIDRSRLATWCPAGTADLGTDDGADDTTSGDLVRRITAVWTDALGIARLGPDESVVDRGADSLVMARVTGQLRTELPEAAAHSYDVLLRRMLNFPTVAALADFLAPDTNPVATANATPGGTADATPDPAAPGRTPDGTPALAPGGASAPALGGALGGAAGGVPDSAADGAPDPAAPGRAPGGTADPAPGGASGGAAGGVPGGVPDSAVGGALSGAAGGTSAVAPGRGAAAGGNASNGLPVPFGGSGRTTRVLFHAALGTMDFFRPIAATLADQDLGPVIGIAVADADRYCAVEPSDLIGAIADDYCRLLLDEGHTRVQLIGYCLGGLVATEVARRLAERGVPPADLTLIDSIPMLVRTDEELLLESVFVPNLGLDPVAAVFGPDVPAADVYRAMDVVRARNGGAVPAGALAGLDGDPGLAAVAAAARARTDLGQDHRLSGYAEAAAARSGLPVGPELVPALFRVCRHSTLAAQERLEPYLGDMTFLRASEGRSFGLGAEGITELVVPYWEDTCLGHLSVRDVPGDHLSVIEPPHLSTVAEHLARPLRQDPS